MERSKFKQGSNNNNNSSRSMKQMHEYCNKLMCNKGWDANFGGTITNNNWKEGDLSWPPRSYTCSFCKREFRSAQALGGHMNVHRRDRARLRLSPTSILTTTTTPHGHNKNHLALVDHLTPTLNPNPSLFTKFPHFTSTLPPKRFEDDDGVKKMKGHFGVRKFCGGGGGSSGVDKSKVGVRLELGIGLISHGHQSKDQELDLELRLGYTS